MSISVLASDDLGRVVGGVDNSCGVPLPPAQRLIGTKNMRIKQAVGRYIASPDFSLREEINYFTHLAPGTLDAHAAKICSTRGGRQYIANMNGAFDKK